MIFIKLDRAMALARYIKHLSATTTRRWLGNISLPDSNTCKEIARWLIEGDLICISDGTLKTEKGSHAWIITNITDKHRLHGAGAVDGDPNTISPFWAELQGKLAVIIMMNLIM